MDWLDLKSVDILVGLVVTVVTGGSGIALWFGRRIRAASQDVVREVGERQRATGHKLSSVEQEVAALGRKVARVEERVTHTEKQLETVARQSDLAAVQTSLAEMNGTMRAVSGQLDTLYKAALRAGQDNGK